MFLAELSDFSLQSLRIFTYVSSLGSVGEAANALGLTQPAVSLQVHNLEKQLGFHLFERQGRKNVLTARGQSFHQKLLPHLERLEQLMVEVKGRDPTSKPELNIGSVEGIGEFWLWTRFSEFGDNQRSLRLNLEIGGNESLQELLLTGQLALVVTARKLEHPRIISQGLMEERFVPVGTKKNIKTLRDALDRLKDGERPWEKVSWIGYGDSQGVDPWNLRWLEERGLLVDKRFRYAHRVNSYSVVKQLMSAGLGIGVVPLHTCENEIRSGTLVSLESKKYPALKNSLYISYREDSLNAVHKEFKDWILATAKSYADAD